MEDSAQQFYDSMASDYHLIFKDWDQAIEWQGEALYNIIQKKIKYNTPTMLDCSCGIGTQAIGLAKKGYQVTASDISPTMIDRAKVEAHLRGVNIQFEVADFRTLEKDIKGQFDIVLSADNAIPHLLTDSDLEKALKNMYLKLKSDGLLLLTIRDYDEMVKNRPEVTQPRMMDNGKRIVFQAWDWAEDFKTYTVKHFIIQEVNGEWVTKHNETKYRALLRDELNQFLLKTGYQDIEWLLPEQSGFYQPIVMARKLEKDEQRA